MVYSRAEPSAIFEHYFAPEKFTDVHEAFSDAYADKEVSNNNNTASGKNFETQDMFVSSRWWWVSDIKFLSKFCITN
jgi:hypothetical protein